MPAAQDLIDALDSLLEPQLFDDYGPNGLQVPGNPSVETVVTGVSAQVELFERAIELGAELVVVHHGLFWDGDSRRVDAQLKRRLKLLFDHDVGLAAYHLPLDGHPEVGNNALIAAQLGCVERTPFAVHRGRTIGVQGRFEGGGIEASDLFARVAALTGRDPLVFDGGPPRVRTLGVVSGAGTGYLGDAIAAGQDAFITGEPAERAMAQSREAGLHFIAAGHYATETLGVRRLGDLLAERFGVRQVFVDLPNPI